MQIEQELAYRQKINPLQFFEHLPLTQKFHDCESRIKGIFGGNRSGKTEELSEYVIKKCLAKSKQRWWAVSETFSTSVDIQQRKVWKLIPKNRIKYGSYDEINGFPNRKLLFDNGSIIIFKSYDQGVQSFASDDVDGIWNDEEPPYDIYKEEKMRLLDRDGEMLFSMTSLNGITDLIQDIFEDHDVIESQYSPIVKETLPRIVEKNGMMFYLLWTTENKHINQSRTAEDIKLMTPSEIKTRIHGLPTNLSGKIYPIFSKGIHVIPFDVVPDNNICLYHILDPHDRKPWAMAWILLHCTGTGYLIDEYPNRNFNDMLSDDKTYDQYVDIIKQKEETLKEIFKVEVSKRIIDPNFGNKTIRLAEKIDDKAHTTPKEELKRRGLNFQDGIDALENGHLKVREVLHYEKVGSEITKQPKFFITDNCENTIRHISRYSRKDILTNDGDVKDKVGPQEKYKDFCDLIRYFWMSGARYIGELRDFKPNQEKVY